VCCSKRELVSLWCVAVAYCALWRWAASVPCTGGGAAALRCAPAPSVIFSPSGVVLPAALRARVAAAARAIRMWFVSASASRSGAASHRRHHPLLVARPRRLRRCRCLLGSLAVLGRCGLFRRISRASYAGGAACRAMLYGVVRGRRPRLRGASDRCGLVALDAPPSCV